MNSHQFKFQEGRKYKNLHPFYQLKALQKQTFVLNVLSENSTLLICSQPSIRTHPHPPLQKARHTFLKLLELTEPWKHIFNF